MCQCLPCGCCWWNCCGNCGLGIGCQQCCFSTWMCKSDQLKSFNPQCCQCCKFVGFGGVCCCFATIFCAQQWVKRYYMKVQSKNKSYDP